MFQPVVELHRVAANECVGRPSHLEVTQCRESRCAVFGLNRILQCHACLVSSCATSCGADKEEACAARREPLATGRTQQKGLESLVTNTNDSDPFCARPFLLRAGGH